MTDTNDHPEIAKLSLSSTIHNNSILYFRNVRSQFYKIYVVRLGTSQLEQITYSVATLLDLNYYAKSGTIKMQYDSYDAAYMIKQDVAEALGMSNKNLHCSMI